jgi:predicted MFS family arabinose efflux permease
MLRKRATALAHPVPVALLLIVSGMAIAPTLIASVGVIQSAVDQSRLNKALAWNSTGLAGGVAAGAAVVGRVIDSSDAQAGFIAVATAGLLLAISAFFVRGPRTSGAPDGDHRHPAVTSPDSIGTSAADSSRPPVGTRH